MLKNLDVFKAKIIQVGTSKGVIIPSNNVKFADLEDGDKIKIWFRKLKDGE